MPKVTEGPESAAIRKLHAALEEESLVILMRVKNDRLEYSFHNRPDPTMSQVTDAILMASIIAAGRDFDFKKHSKTTRVKAIRNNGQEIVYKDRVTIDFDAQVLRSTRNRDVTLNALSIVVQNLASEAVEQAGATPPPSEHGAN